jgi:hypothetical protein
MSFPKSDLLSEIGWEPINEFLDRQRVNYIARFDELPVMQNCIHGTKKFRMCGMEVCKLYENKIK